MYKCFGLIMSDFAFIIAFAVSTLLEMKEILVTCTLFIGLTEQQCSISKQLVTCLMF